MAVMLAAKAKIEATAPARRPAPSSHVGTCGFWTAFVGAVFGAVFTRIQRPAGPQWCRVRGL